MRRAGRGAGSRSPASKIHRPKRYALSHQPPQQDPPQLKFAFPTTRERRAPPLGARRSCFYLASASPVNPPPLEPDDRTTHRRVRPKCRPSITIASAFSLKNLLPPCKTVCLDLLHRCLSTRTFRLQIPERSQATSNPPGTVSPRRCSSSLPGP